MSKKESPFKSGGTMEGPFGSVDVKVPVFSDFHMEKQAKSFVELVDGLVKSRIKERGFRDDLERITCIGVPAGDLYYYTLDDGTMTPLIALTRPESKWNEGDINDIARNTIRVTWECSELPMDVFKPNTSCHEQL